MYTYGLPIPHFPSDVLMTIDHRFPKSPWGSPCTYVNANVANANLDNPNVANANQWSTNVASPNLVNTNVDNGNTVEPTLVKPKLVMGTLEYAKERTCDCESLGVSNTAMSNVVTNELAMSNQ